jgi:hypothetical protein
MPLLAGKRNVGRNIAEMEAAGHPRAQSIAAALRKAGVKRKDPPMKKSHGDGMGGERGMSPRKAMASGMAHGEGFGVESFHEMNGGAGEHPDHKAGTGEKRHMEDHERATPPGIHHTKGHHPAQAAPRHGPHMDTWNREGKV